MGISFRRLCSATLAKGQLRTIAALENIVAKFATMTFSSLFPDIYAPPNTVSFNQFCWMPESLWCNAA
jgi:hypothetical protein